MLHQFKTYPFTSRNVIFYGGDAHVIDIRGFFVGTGKYKILYDENADPESACIPSPGNQLDDILI
jgi:hypothetical protein